MKIGGEVGFGPLDDAANQRIAIRVRARRGEAEYHVARGNGLAIDDFRLFDRADGEAGQVVFAGGVHVGHFGGFATNQRTTGEFAALGDAFDHSGGRADVELAAGKVIEEEQRFRPLHEDVVDAHRDKVLPHRVMAVELEGQLQLGADAIGTRNEHGLLVFLRDLEERAEAADAAQHLGAHGAFRGGLDAFDQRIAGIDVDARIAVRHGSVGISHDRKRDDAKFCGDNSCESYRIPTSLDPALTPL